MKLQRGQMIMYGVLIGEDVFVYDGEAHQKMWDDTAYNPTTKSSITISIRTKVKYIGSGTWPTPKEIKA